MRKKFKNYSSKGLKNKAKGISNKLRITFTNIKNKIFNKKVYLKGEESPKSYAFSKKFFILYFLFGFYSFILLWGINDPNNIFIKYLAFGNPFSFGTALLVFFLILSIILNYDKLRNYIFESFTFAKQILIFGLIFAGLYLLFNFISTNINLISYFLFLSFVWIVLLSSRFYIYSRKFATKIEYAFLEKYSKSRYLIIMIIPTIIAIILVFIALLYRTLLVYISLDIFGPTNPHAAVGMYTLEMKWIMPMIYFNLVMVIIFLIVEFISTRRRAETKRVGTFDNFTFSLVVLFIFFFQIFQISVYLLLQPETLEAIRSSLGTNSGALTSVFIFEFFISMLFLYRVIVKLGKSYGWQFLFFKRDGLVLFFLGCVLAQTLARFTLANNIPNQQITILGEVFLSDKYIISIFMTIFLGITLLVYYIKPHQTSMFMRIQKETINKEEESMQIVYKLLRGEYIRRGDAFPIEIMDRELIKATKLSKAVIYSLIKRLAEKDVNMFLSEVNDNFGNKVQWIKFISVTEQFEKRDIAEKKVKKYLSEELVKTTSKTKSEMGKLGKDLKSDKASDQFIASLTNRFDKRQQHKIERREKLQKLKDFPFKAKEINDEMKKTVLDIIKKEYITRIQDISRYQDFYIPISEIGEKIRIKTKIPLGFLYILLENIAKADMELKLMDNPEDDKNKTIRFIPVYDKQLYNLLQEFRPNECQELRTFFWVNFLISFQNHDSKKCFKNLYKNIDKKSEWRKRFRFLKDKYEKSISNKEKIFTLEKLAEIFAEVRKIKKQKILLSGIPKTKIKTENNEEKMVLDKSNNSNESE
ncbi:MAG: hypothetical protein JXA99_01855 [Candidatus Lokiarchaeota archaeon]|nr:hypothetical protein [Candidatus Lokiarchaeota archaeon]